MNQIYESAPSHVKQMDTQALRENFLLQKLMVNGEINFTYSHYDRMVIGGAVPSKEMISLDSYESLRSNYFLERREMGIINVGGKGVVVADDNSYELDKLDCLYLGRGVQKVAFQSASDDDLAHFFLFSAPAHKSYPTKLFRKSDAEQVKLGSPETANERTIFKYIHPAGIESCQVVMGITVLAECNVWNTMPPHTHDRRSEAYFYFDIKESHGVMHFMGQPQETRHLWVQNREAVISPPWSIHAGSGTSNYAFIWAMAGENQDFTDMDFFPLSEIR